MNDADGTEHHSVVDRVTSGIAANADGWQWALCLVKYAPGSGGMTGYNAQHAAAR